jgi:hypothetical protein
MLWKICVKKKKVKKEKGKQNINVKQVQDINKEIYSTQIQEHTRSRILCHRESATFA